MREAQRETQQAIVFEDRFSDPDVYIITRACARISWEVPFEPETYRINEVIALPANKKAINVPNYVFFVGSEFRSPSDYGLRALN